MYLKGDANRNIDDYEMEERSKEGNTTRGRWSNEGKYNQILNILSISNVSYSTQNIKTLKCHVLGPHGMKKWNYSGPSDIIFRKMQ